MNLYLDVFFCFFSFTSLVASFMLMSAIRDKSKSIKITLVLEVVFFTTASLGLYTFFLLCIMVPKLVTGGNTDFFLTNIDGKYLCLTISLLGDFSFLSSILWYATLSWMLLMLLRGNSMEWLRKTSSIQHIVVWTVSCILTLGQITPYIIYDDVRNYCWVKQDSNIISIIFFYAPAMGNMIFSFVVLVISLYRLKHKKVIFDITAFVGCFVTMWIGPSVEAVANWLGYVNPWLTILKITSNSLAGLAHFLIWIQITQSMGTLSINALNEEILNLREGGSRMISTIICTPGKAYVSRSFVWTQSSASSVNKCLEPERIDVISSSPMCSPKSKTYSLKKKKHQTTPTR